MDQSEELSRKIHHTPHNKILKFDDVTLLPAAVVNVSQKHQLKINSTHHIAQAIASVFLIKPVKPFCPENNTVVVKSSSHKNKSFIDIIFS